ncbi:hypothetical protein [Rhodococcus opacus]|uniref:hypothetical protein n=1 Tax=Rhodococcus opacus TaxID=37919 RepID=UPI00155A6F82|nr:hypothetical protein [Rhodococcus opacus]
MPETPEPGKKSASPYSTGGGGVRLEHRLGAVFLTRLLTQGVLSELGDRAPVRVEFQQSPATTVDDLVLTTQAADGAPSVRLEIAVRRTPKFVESNDDTQSLVLALVKADLEAERASASDPLVETRLAVAVSGQQTHSRELAELAVVARSQVDADAFHTLINTPGKFKTHKRLGQLTSMVGTALSKIDGAAAGADAAKDRCWRLLARLWIIAPDLEPSNDTDWAALVNDLVPVTGDHSRDAAVALRDRLEQLSAEFAQNAGTVDVQLLRRRLHGEIDPAAHVPPAGWNRLRELDREARSGVARELGTAPALVLPRQALRDELRAAIDAPGDLVVKGDSGVGKSALTMDVVEHAESDDHWQAIVLNLRHLPDNQLSLLDHLSSPLTVLFGELTAPDRLVIIDGAEAAAESHGTVFSSVVRSVREAGVKVVAIAATEGSAAATELMKSGGAATTEYVVSGLTDEEIDTAAGHFPGLQRLAQDPRARELLRRPIVIDLLGRAGNPGLPLSDVEALEHIWRSLVRNGDRRDAGAPDAREQVMLRLAAHALDKGNADDLLSRLDNDAVEGLRRSGVILPASGQPWDRVPEFKHDLLRVYSIARHLLAERDPAAALTSVRAPRWALPSARLACEIVLSVPDTSAYPLSGRFAELQTNFEKLVAAGCGERWADVPTEALLAVPTSPLILQDAWPLLTKEQAHGLARAIRILYGRHRRRGILEAIIAEPVVIRLANETTPRALADKIGELIRDWLQSHVLRHTTAGQPTRVAIRDAILEQCAEAERVLDGEDAAAQAALAARTPEEIAADEERRKRIGASTTFHSSSRRRRPEPARRRPYLWISDIQIEHLALLGPDLGANGEAILRRIGEDEPHSLVHAVEPFLAGHSLAAYSPKLLIDLSAAYYIEDDEDEEDEDDEFGWSGGLREEGIRDHRASGGLSPLAAFTHGSFLAMLQTDYRGSVAFLNSMLNHAARYRARTVSGPHRYGTPSDESATQHTLSITGVERTYIGDSHVWLWYRGTGVGPYPCMSALQALEYVTEELIKAGGPATRLVQILLEDADNLAMPALALAILVRHLEDVEDALDPFLVEPGVWELEFTRAVHEHPGIGLTAQTAELGHPERRGWSLREVSMSLALRAEGDRIENLKRLGEQLLANAVAQVVDDTTPGAQQHLAAVKNWAATLDRKAYELQDHGGQILIQLTPDPDVEEILGETNADLRRVSDATGLVVRHAHVRDHGGRAPDMTDQVLAADIAIAKDLLEDPPQPGRGVATDGPVAVAASAIELHLTGRARVTDDDLQWSAKILLGVAAQCAANPADGSDDSLFSQGADRSAGRAMPYLLLPTARDLRRALDMNSVEGVQSLVALSGAIASRASSEARLAYASALDTVWEAPCNQDHLDGRCHHRIAMNLVQESILESTVGPWDSEVRHRPTVRLDPPTFAALAAVDGTSIRIRLLTPALRATGSASSTIAACCKDEAQQAVDVLLAAHQRAMLGYKRGYHHSQSDSLVAARAALWQAIDRRDEPVLDYVTRYLDNSKLLSEALQAITMAGQERATSGEHARRVWPRIMDLVLDAAEATPRIFAERTWGDYAESALIPNPSAASHYLTSEMRGKPSAWRGLLSWTPQVERWLGATTCSRMSIDHLVIAVNELEIPAQVETGLNWIERVVERSGKRCAATFTLPEWLRERRPDLTTDEQSMRWQRVVDLLVVAGDSRVADLAD